MVIRELQKWAQKSLKEAGIISADFESKEMIIQVFGDEIRTKITMNEVQNEWVSEKQRLCLEDMVKRRIAGEPLQYIFGEWEFYGRRILCRKEVLIPRPETELLVELGISLLQGRDKAKVLDLCCGSGCIGLTIGAEKGHKVTLVDISENAIALAKENALRFGVSAAVVQHSVFDIPLSMEFDLLISNPPYIVRKDLITLQKEVQYEPTLALDGGEDGYDFYREIIIKWKSSIRKGGYIALEIGIGQNTWVAHCLEEQGFSDIVLYPDYDKIIRMVSAKKA